MRFDILAIDARTTVLNRQFYAVLYFAGRQGDCPAFGCVAQGIFKDVGQYLGHAARDRCSGLAERFETAE